MAKALPPEVQAIISASDAGLHATTVKLVQGFLADNPSSQRAWLDLGHALGNLARYSEAENAFNRAIELADGGPVDAIYGEIGHLYRAQGKFEEAVEWYQKQIDADPTDASGYVFLGNVQRVQGKSTEAIETFKLALNCELGCLEEAHYSLGLAYRNHGQYFEAKVQFEKAIAMDQKFAAAKLALKDVSGCC